MTNKQIQIKEPFDGDIVEINGVKYYCDGSYCENPCYYCSIRGDICKSNFRKTFNCSTHSVYFRTIKSVIQELKDEVREKLELIEKLRNI